MKIQRKGNNKKNNLTFKLLYLLLISLLVVNYSISRYKSTYNTTATGNLAKFVFKTNETTQEEFTINLAETALVSQYVDRTQMAIAPGSKGKVELDIDCTDSKVAIDYQIDMVAPETLNIPDEIEFYTLQDGERVDLGQSRASVYTIADTRTLEQIKKFPVQTIYLYWEWKINPDVEESSYEGKNFKINATITGKQHLDS